MPNYSFLSLSDYDFETLVRDLLQEELNITLETFTSGRDGGIDLRHSRDSARALVVQCKHYERSGYPALLRAVRAEATKLPELAPCRYVLATSVPLTPHRKQEMLDALSPYCQTPQDIFGYDDLNNLLGKFPTVERRHHKLWLTSTSVLQMAIQAKIFNESAAELERIRIRTSRYVQNDSFNRALDVLDDQRYCIVVGIPGIGKTTLAEMLMIAYVNRGFEAYRIWENVSEAREVFNPEKKQVFYYDDFLGRTGLAQKLAKNEDERLLRFISDVRRSKHSRFILTTREYILNQAKVIYEALAQSNFEAARCVVNLQDYTPYIRAKILYNHLYFSDLPNKYVAAFAQPEVYNQVIRHHNFNPRIIERMTDYLNVGHQAPKQYVASFIHNLNNPHRVWEFAFNNHLSAPARDLLLTLVSLPDVVFQDDVDEAFQSFQDFRYTRYHQPLAPHQFRKALRELDGNFIRTEQSAADIVIQFHNPSIRDFLEAHLKANPREVKDLLAGSCIPDQVLRLWRGAGTADHQLTKCAAESLGRTIDHPTGQLVKYSGHSYWSRAYYPREKLFQDALVLCARSMNETVLTAFSDLAVKFTNWLVEHDPSPGGLVPIVTAIADGQVPRVPATNHLHDLAMLQILEGLRSDEMDLDDFKAVMALARAHPSYFSPEDMAAARESFGKFCVYEIDAIKDDGGADTMTVWYSDLESVAQALDMSLPDTLDEVMTHATPEPYHEDDDDWRRGSTDTAHGSDEEEIRSMFETIVHRRSND